MKIKLKKGNHFEEDKLITIETKGSEAFSLYKLILLINQLSLNEANKYEGVLKRGCPFFFQDAMEYSILQGKLGVDLMDNSNERYLKEICEKWKLNFEKFEQTKIEDFINENI